MSIAAIDQELIAPHYSNRLLQGLLAHLEETEGRELLDAVVADAGLPWEHLHDSEGWVSIEYIHRVARAVARRLHGLDELPPHDHAMWSHWREAGRANVRPGMVGALYPVIRALGSPDNLYRAMPALAARGNRLVTLQAEAVRGGRAVLIAGPSADEPRNWTSSNCWVLFGMLEAAPTIWRLPPARVVHAECMHDRRRPAKRCVYRISYETRRIARVASVAVVGAVGVTLSSAASWALGHGPSVLVAALGAGIALAFEGWRRYFKAARGSRRDIEQLGHLIEEADLRYARLWQDERELRRSLLTARKLSGYLPPDVVERFVEHPEAEMTLGGRLTRAAVLFADIVGYTLRSEQRSPEDVVDELNRYFSYVDPVFQQHHGVIDKRMGDGVMVVFVPRPGEEARDLHERAVCCAIQMLSALARCNDELKRDGGEPLSIRIGIAAGELIKGNMGSSVRFEYTVIGDVVNVAARLETNATPGHALVAAEMVDGLSEAVARSVRMGERHPIVVKGRREPVDVIELAPLAPDNAEQA